MHPFATLASRHRLFIGVCLACSLAGFCIARGQDTRQDTPSGIAYQCLIRLMDLIEPLPGAPTQCVSTRLKLVRAAGVPRELLNRELDLSLQPPDRLRLSAQIEGQSIQVGRDGQQLWLHAPGKKFGLLARTGVLRFAANPASTDTSTLEPIMLPWKREVIVLVLAMARVTAEPSETIDGVRCHVLQAKPLPEAVKAFKIPNIVLRLWVRGTDMLPARLGYADDKGTDLQLEFRQIKVGPPPPAEQWKLAPNANDKIETVALSHLKTFLEVARKTVGKKVPPLGSATGERRLLAEAGKGRLELIDGTRVLFLRGTPEEMGGQHGALLQPQVCDVTRRMLYGIGVGSSFVKGSWFFGEIESAQQRLMPFLDPRYVREMDALAGAAGVEKEEARLANLFPELFHCSGFAVFGDATVGGRMYHGRILDYMKGVGLEQNAVVMVFQPDQGNAWVNVGYAGFIGSVTAMNEKHIAIGEMGGRGEGKWDGKPMAQLVREVMEKANTLDEAVEIMRRGPRTCEYYYVISDGRTKRAVGIAATPDKFETIWPGQRHPQLPHAIKDAVLMSAGDRYEELAKRVQARHGKLDADGARDLMTRPVCMTSNIHSVLFAPDTLDFWVANADSEHVASHARYTRYNLRALLDSPIIKDSSAAGGR